MSLARCTTPLSSLTGRSSITPAHIAPPFFICYMFHMFQCAVLQGAVFSGGKLSTNLCFSPGRALSKSYKSFFFIFRVREKERETDWNNGRDYTLNGFLLRCSARLSTASKEKQREREVFCIMGAES